MVLSNETLAGILLGGVAGCFIIADVTVKKLDKGLQPNDQREMFFGTLFTTLICMGIIGVIDSHIRNDVAAPLGIVSFEFAFNKENASKMIDSWSLNDKLWVALSLGADLLFLGLYSTCIALGCLMVGRGSDLASKIASLQFAAALLDFIENTCLFFELQAENHNFDERLPFIAGSCATIKFLFGRFLFSLCNSLFSVNLILILTLHSRDVFYLLSTSGYWSVLFLFLAVPLPFYSNPQEIRLKFHFYFIIFDNNCYYY